MPDPIQDNDKVKALYDGVSKDYNLGTYDEFKAKLQDPAKRKAFYEGVGKEYQLGTFDEFETKVGVSKKKVVTQPFMQPASASAKKSQLVVSEKEIQPTSDVGTGNNAPIVPSWKMQGKQPLAKESTSVFPTTKVDVEQKQIIKEEQNKALNNTVKARLKSKNISFKDNDATYNKEKDEVSKEIENGNLAMTKNAKGDVVLGRRTGLWESFGDSFINGFKEHEFASKANMINDPKELANYLNEVQEKEPDLPKVESGLSGYVGGLLGGLPKMVGVMASGSAATGGLPVGGVAAIAGESQWLGMANKRRELYVNRKNELIKNGVPIEEAEIRAAKSAMEDAPLAAIPNTAINTFLVSMGGANATPQLAASRKAFANTLKATEASAAKTATQEVKDMISRAAQVGAAGGAAPLVEYGIEKSQGYDVNIGEALDKAGKGFADFALMDVAFHTVLAPKKFTKTTLSAAKEFLSNIPTEVILEQAEKFGADAPNLLSQLESYRNARGKVADYIPQDIMHNVAGLQEAIDNKTAKLSELKSNNVPDAIVKSKQEEIDALKERQNKIIETGKGNENEVDELTGEPIESKISVETPQDVAQQQRGEVITTKETEYTPETKKSGVSIILPKPLEGEVITTKPIEKTTTESIEQIPTKEESGVAAKPIEVSETAKEEVVPTKESNVVEGSVGVGVDVKQQELDAQKINKEAGVDVYVARQGVETNGEKYTLSQIKENGNTNTFVIEDANGSEIGKAQLSADGNYLENIRIDEKHRRKGLASKVYDFIELRKGIELQPSPNKQSKEAKALWDNRNLKKSVSNKANGGLLAKSLGEAMSKTFADFKNKQQVLLELENKYFEQKGISKEDFNKLNETEKAEIIKDAVKWKNENPELVKAVEQSLKEQPKEATPKVEDKPTTIQENETFTKREQLIEKAKSLSDNVQGLYKDVFKENVEETLFEAAIQANSSESEKKGAVATFGKEIVDIAQKLYPNAKVGDKFENLKKESNAVSIEKTNEVDVRKQTTDGEGMGKGNIEPEKPTKESEQKGTVQENVQKEKVTVIEPETAAKNAEVKELDKLANNVPDSGKVAEYMSKDTIEKYTDETPTNNQQRGVQELEIALEHGEKIIEKAKEIYGTDYVEKTLDYIENSTASVSNKALMYVSLENSLGREKLLNPEKAADISKQQALVYAKSQAFARESSLALNYQKLRKIAQVGYDISKVTDSFFSAEERMARNDLSKAIEANADEINKAAEDAYLKSEADIEKLVKEGVEKEIAKVYEKMPSNLKKNADAAIAAIEKFQKEKLRSKAYDATIGIPIAIIDAGMTTIKMAIKAGVKIADAIELGIEKIKEKYGKEWENEADFRKDVTDAFANLKIEKSATKDVVKDALIEKGFGREIKVKGEKKKVLDWKKLAGAAGTVSKISENVADVIKGKYSEKEIASIQKEFIDEYIDLRTSVIEKAQNELARRNKKIISAEQKSAAKKLAELYAYGLFEGKVDEFEYTLSRAMGADINEAAFYEARDIAKGLETIYSSSFKGIKLTDVSAKAAINKLEDRLRILLFKEAKKQGNFALKAANIVRNYFDLQQTMVLNNMKQAVENPLSGLQQVALDKINSISQKTTTKELAEQRRKMMKTVYKDMIINGEIGYGKVESQFVTRQHIDDYVNSLSNNKLYHGIASVATGKATLNAMDAMYKQALTETKFVGNLVKVLTHETNPNKMSKSDALKFVSEKLTGQTFKDAQSTASEIIQKINKDAGSDIMPHTQESIDRFANDIVKASLEMGGKITADQITAAYNAAYKAAGLGLGHEANNFLSSQIGAYTAKLESKINNAIQEKEWNRAALLTAQSIAFRNILNPFIGGGTNWLVLKMEKTGLGLVTGLGYKIGSNTNVDLSTEAGMKVLENRLYNQSRIKDQYMRGLVGGIASVLAYGAFAGLTNTDDYRKWRTANPWAARYLDVVTPEYLLAEMAVKNDKAKKYLASTMNKNDAFDASTKIMSAADYGIKGQKDKMWGAIGEAVGSKLNTPLPWRLVKDGVVLYQGVKGQDPYHGNYQASKGFMNGVFQGGFIEWLGGRPDAVSSSSSSSSNKKGFKKGQIKSTSKGYNKGN